MFRVNLISRLLSSSNSPGSFPTCLSLVKHSTLVDIGSDHAYLGLKLLQEALVNSVWNVEITLGPLNRSKKTYENTSYLNDALVKFYLSDGFTKVPELPKNSLVVISGLGSSAILNILSRLTPESARNIKNLVLIPHTPPVKLRRWLEASRLTIDTQLYFKEKGLIYVLLVITGLDGFVPAVRCSDTSLTLDTSATGEALLTKEGSTFDVNNFKGHNPELAREFWSVTKNKIINKEKTYWKQWEIDFLYAWEKCF